MISEQQCRELYIEACELELQAFKPGNVSVYANGHDMCVEDFRRSAAVSASAMGNPELSLGEKIFYAVESTRMAVGCNTNLGIILLCAPLIQAAYAVSRTVSLQQALAQVLDNTTLADANWVFKAIQLAAPGGLGDVDAEDVHSAPTLTLREAMQLASHRDRIALHYVSNFKDVFDFGVLRYNHGFIQWRRRDWATALVYTGLLSHYPDSHIERKYGDRYADIVTTKMTMLDAALCQSVAPELLIPLFTDVDQAFKRDRINPGTTADLTVATALVVLLTDVLNAV
jgi:triphosphoribosyl-dephospho-CoA synthase